MRTRRRYAAPLVAALAYLAAPALGGFVRTTDGREYEGTLNVSASGKLVVTPKTGGKAAAVEVDLADVLQAHFRDSLADARAAREHPKVDPKPPAPLVAWKDADVGPVGSAGTSRNEGKPGTLLVIGSGSHLSGAVDSFHFAYVPLTGDGQIVARLAELRGPSHTPRAGLMVRESLDPGARHADYLILPDAAAAGGNFARAFYHRPDFGAQTLTTLPADEHDKAVGRLATWMKLARRGNVVRAYASRDGHEWREVASQEVKFGADALVGLAVCGHESPATATAVFDSLAVGPEDPQEMAREASHTVAPSTPAVRKRVEPKCVALSDGTVLVNATLQGASASKIGFNADGKTYTLPAASVARVVLRPLTPDLAARIPAHTPGVLMAAGDFIEGEFHSCDGGWVKISSVLFGLAARQVNDVAAIILSDAADPSAALTVRTADGSLYAARSVKTLENAALLEEPSLGGVRVESGRLLEIRPGGARCTWLGDVKGAKVETPRGVGHGIVQTAGTAMNYELGGKYKALIARAGVADGTAPASPLRLIVLADGKELLRTPPLSAGEEPAAVVLSLAGVKTLTLKVEAATLAANNSAAPAVAVWGEAQLVK